MQNAINEPVFYKSSTEAVSLVESNKDEKDKDLYRFVATIKNRSNGFLKQKPHLMRAFNPAEDYDLWFELYTLKANILVAQLIQISPTLQNNLRKGRPLFTNLAS